MFIPYTEIDLYKYVRSVLNNFETTVLLLGQKH